jgi:hypothetical protein
MRTLGWTVVLGLIPSLASAQTRRTERVILVTLDGARWQEIFSGLDLEVLRSTIKPDDKTRAEDTAVYQRFWAPTPQERRAKLLPFLWDELALHRGSIAGNPALGSSVTITNRHRFSYPGYSEILTGRARDELINSNDRRQSPVPTVLEFSQRELGLDARGVAVFASWEVFNWIVEQRAGALTCNAGYEAYEHQDPSTAELSKLQYLTPTPWDTVRHDLYTFRFAMAHLTTWQPRLLYLALGETDDWAHDGRYDRVLEALARSDAFLRQLFDAIDRLADYRGKTTVLITADHGRGDTPTDWRDHGEKVEGAQRIWLAVASPDLARRGEWRGGDPIRQNQIAATICRFLGLDPKRFDAEAGAPVAAFFDP